MIRHQVAYRAANGLVIGIGEWRYRPIDARKAIQLFDEIKTKYMAWRLENGYAVESFDPSRPYGSPPAWVSAINHYEDGTVHLKEFMY